MLNSSTLSTATYTLPLADLKPTGMVLEQDLQVISGFSWGKQNRGVFTRIIGGRVATINFEVGRDHLYIGYALQGKRASY